MRALIDTDVILDVLLARPEFVEAAAGIWKANHEGRFEGYIAAITPLNVFYIARKLKGQEIAQRAIMELLAQWRVCPLDQDTLKAALNLPLVDYEDAVQHMSASNLKIEFLVTRNLDDYKGATLRVISPTDFLALL